MTLNEQIKAILEPLGVPVAYGFYKGNKTTYLRYSIYDEYGNDFADDEEVNTNYPVQVDAFSKGNVDKLAEDMKKTMIAAGFSRTGYYENVEPDTGYYQKTYRFIKTIDNTEV